jgi:hypothetical protein
VKLRYHLCELRAAADRASSRIGGDKKVRASERVEEAAKLLDAANLIAWIDVNREAFRLFILHREQAKNDGVSAD